MIPQFQFHIARFEDGVLTLGMEPPVNVAGWTCNFTVQKRLGGSTNLILKSCASGYGGGQSGITVVNSGIGTFNVKINSVDTSGLEYGNYACQFENLTSGQQKVVAEGYLSILPN